MLSLAQPINHIGPIDGGHVSPYYYIFGFELFIFTSLYIVFSATILMLVNVFSTRATMKLMGFLTVVKLFVLGLIAIIGLLVLLKVIPSDVDASLNLSFYGTSTTVGPYASALYYVCHDTFLYY